MNNKYFKKTKVNDSLGKQELINKIAELTQMNKTAVKDVIEALTDIAIEEIVTCGAFRLPEVFSVIRDIKYNHTYYHKSSDNTLILPEYPKLKIALNKGIKELAKEYYENVIIKTDNSNPDTWWLKYKHQSGSPYYVKGNPNYIK